MHKILVTGGNGFLGQSLTKELVKIYGGDSIFAPSSKELNLLNIEEVESYFKVNDFDIVIHLAAKMAGIGSLTNNPLPYLEDNLVMNYNIVKVAMNYNIKKFVTLGSSCGYNNKTPLPMSENEFWNKKPENTYGICKLIMLEHLQSQNKMKWVYLVPANIYGPGDHFGEKDAHIIPATVLKFEKATMNDLNYIEVWGDGSQVRDFIYIDDVVNILCNAVENEKYVGIPINLSTNTGNSIKEIVEIIRESMNLTSIQIEWDITKPTGILKKILDNKLFLQIEQEYSFTDIKTGLSETIDWYRNQKNGDIV